MQAASRKGQKASGVTGLVAVQVSQLHMLLQASWCLVCRCLRGLSVICWCVSVFFLCRSVIFCCVVLVLNGELCVGVLFSVCC